jgi:hypothetical protein
MNGSETTEPNFLVARVEGNTKKIRSILRPSILRLFLGPLVKCEDFAKGISKYTVAMYFKRVEGTSSYLPSSFTPPPLPHKAAYYTTTYQIATKV